MGKTLREIAESLKKNSKKVLLIYAFNGTGKTRLSREFKQLFAATADAEEDSDTGDQLVSPRKKILYYSAFTEDLFYWDNDLSGEADPKLKIQPNAFTDWVLLDQGQDQNVITTFQRYTNDKLTPRFNAEQKDERTGEIVANAFSEVTFSLERGNDDEQSGNLKISKGEESNFIWSIFYALLEQVISTLNEVQPDYPEPTPFDDLECVFIDDPVSSLDDNHLIQLAVELAQQVKSSKTDIRFVITTHNALFFNVLCNEFAGDEKTDAYNWKSRDFRKARLERNSDGSVDLVEQPNDSPFAYHLHLMAQLEQAIKSGQVEKYHFNLLRNVLEKTATFLGYKRWEHLLPETNEGLPDPYAKRIVNFSSHSKHAAEEVQPLKPEEKVLLERLLKHIVERHRFGQQQRS